MIKTVFMNKILFFAVALVSSSIALASDAPCIDAIEEGKRCIVTKTNGNAPMTVGECREAFENASQNPTPINAGGNPSVELARALRTQNQQLHAALGVCEQNFKVCDQECGRLENTPGIEGCSPDKLNQVRAIASRARQPCIDLKSYVCARIVNGNGRLNYSNYWKALKSVEASGAESYGELNANGARTFQSPICQ